MKKLVAAALVLGFVGIAAAGAVGVQRLSNGQCPLTGRPIHCLSSRPDAGSAMDGGEGTRPRTSGAGLAADSAAVQSADAEPVCPKTRRHCCCPSQQKTECEQQAETPVEESKPVQ